VWILYKFIPSINQSYWFFIIVRTLQSLLFFSTPSLCIGSRVETRSCMRPKFHPLLIVSIFYTVPHKLKVTCGNAIKTIKTIQVGRLELPEACRWGGLRPAANPLSSPPSKFYGFVVVVGSPYNENSTVITSEMRGVYEKFHAHFGC
jgi:hypothetical protein